MVTTITTAPAASVAALKANPKTATQITLEQQDSYLLAFNHLYAVNMRRRLQLCQHFDQALGAVNVLCMHHMEVFTL
jgi:hypothetical protein